MLVFTNFVGGADDTNKHATELMNSLKTTLGFTITPVLDVLKPPASWPSADMAELRFAVPAANINIPTAAQLALLEAPLKENYKVIFVRTNVAHDDTPTNFIPLILSSDTVP